MSATATLTNRDHPSMYSSISSLTSTQHQAPSVPRIYKQASQLFLTRRIPEALDVLEAIIQPTTSFPDQESDNEVPSTAPVASATRNARCKVWGLYASLLNEVVELGAEEGKKAFGGARWKELVNKTRDGSIWEEVIKNGYYGSEGSVDAEVVAILATLLLAHAPSQRITQQRLETYLTVIGQPNLDVATHMAQSQRNKDTARSFHASGTSTPRDLNQRLKILEIYTLYVLPRNQEWDYARQFIQMSEVLDEDRKENFLHALQALEDEPKHEAQRAEALKKQRQEQLDNARRRDEEERRMVEKSKETERRVRESSMSSRQSERSQSRLPNSKVSSTTPRPNSKAVSDPRPPPSNTKSSAPPAKRPNPPPPSSFYKRTIFMIFAMQQNLMRMGRSIWRHPFVLMRMVFFLFAIVIALARRDVRERAERMLKSSWEKVRRTIGMGVKVSYI